MILPIDDEYRIKGDKHSWAIQKGRTKKGEITWESVSWFSSLESTVNHLGQLMVRTSDTKTLGDCANSGRKDRHQALTSPHHQD